VVFEPYIQGFMNSSISWYFSKSYKVYRQMEGLMNCLPSKPELKRLGYGRERPILV
jgi:hypothetical protein